MQSVTVWSESHGLEDCLVDHALASDEEHQTKQQEHAAQDESDIATDPFRPLSHTTAAPAW